MKALKTAPVLLAVVIALLALPAAANALYVVPPDNSAVNQYTETVPTAGGGQDTDRQGKGNRSPAKVLGSRNAERLNAHGPEGRAAAEVAAATAPYSGASSPTPAVDAPDTAKHKQAGDGEARKTETASPAISPSSSDPSGSSGIGEVIAQATGSSSGEMGLFLPFLILVALAWSLGYFWRQHRRVG
jgi:hypothetical protein